MAVGAGRRSPSTRRGGRAQIVAAGANLGGLALGALISGVLAQWAGHALSVPFVVFLGALLLAWVALLGAPETPAPRSPRPRYRPHRVSVPAAARGRFFAAALGTFPHLGVFGILTSLAPSFLAGTLHQPSHALAGAVSFAVFAAAALAQMLTVTRTARQLLAAAIPAQLIGVCLLTAAVWLPTPSLVVLTGVSSSVSAGPDVQRRHRHGVRDVLGGAPSRTTPDVEHGLMYAVARDVTERRKTEAEVERLADEQAALRRVATLVARDASQTELLTAIADECARLFGTQDIGMVRYEGDREQVVMASSGAFRAIFPTGSRQR